MDLDSVLRVVKKIIPRSIFSFFQPVYHRALAEAAAVFYRYPSKKLKVIGVTGTNGKTTLVHLLTAILEAAGEPVASVSSLRFKISAQGGPGSGWQNREWKNTRKMTMPGRFAVQKFLRSAVSAGCIYVVLEVTSEGIKQFRHKGIDFYMAILTNVTPEHIESHGTFENYRAAKAELFKAAKIHILNGEDPSIEYFIKIQSKEKIIYSVKDLPKDFKLKMPGVFNLENATAAYHAARTLGVDRELIKKVLEGFENIPGRMEFIQKTPHQVVVDYAHTPDALEKVYEALSPPAGKLICVLGSAGGGRDKWKRPEMGRIAAKHCNEIILTNEDPYDEDPQRILEDVEKGFLFYSQQTMNYKLVLDRREAIRQALKLARIGDTVVITGKGAEPWMMLADGEKLAWDDRRVVREEIKKLGG